MWLLILGIAKPSSLKAISSADPSPGRGRGGGGGGGGINYRTRSPFQHVDRSGHVITAHTRTLSIILIALSLSFLFLVFFLFSFAPRLRCPWQRDHRVDRH